MILGNSAIRDGIDLGYIKIEPFNEKQLNPNSYNLRLYNELLVYTNDVLDCKKDNETKKIIISEKGFELQAGELYLGRTVEYTATAGLVPVIEGRSSIARLGLQVHITAGLGDVGFCGYWTLEIVPTKNVIVYPNMEICQIVYHRVEGCSQGYNGKYQHNNGIQASLMYKDFNNEKIDK